MNLQSGIIGGAPSLIHFLGECTSKVTASGGVFGYVPAGLARKREARMKRVLFVLATGLLCGQALAADLPMPAPPRAPAAFIPVAPPFSWTGIYIGGNAGAAWNRGSFSDANGVGFTLPSNNAVFTGGGQVGGNWQMGALVLGVEGQFDWLANQNNASAGIPVGGNTLQGISTDRWLTTLTGRVGFAADHWLFYAKGGGAWVGNQSFTVNNVTTGQSFTTSNGGWNTGWTVGGGIEWAFAGPWSAKIEYDYIKLSSNSFTVPTPSPLGVLPGDTFTTANRNIQTVLFGVNYRFGGW
jgi:outer membrane immunogenic protein